MRRSGETERRTRVLVCRWSARKGVQSVRVREGGERPGRRAEMATRRRRGGLLGVLLGLIELSGVA